MVFACYLPSGDETFGAHIEELSRHGHQITINSTSPETSFIWCYGIEKAEEAFLASKMSNVPLLSYVLDIPFWRLNDPRWKGYYENYKKVLLASQKIFALSCETRRMIKEFVEKESIVWRMGIPITQLDPSSSEFRLDEEYQIISINRFVDHKHLEVIIEALFRLPDPPRIIYVGKGGYQPVVDRCKALARRYQIECEFKVALPLPEMAMEIKKSMFLVSASTFEGFGMSPGEALYLERPAIASDIPVFHEIYGKTIDYFRPLDPEELAEKMRYLIKNPAYRKEKARQGRGLILKEYTIKRAVERFNSLVIKGVEDHCV